MRAAHFPKAGPSGFTGNGRQCSRGLGNPRESQPSSGHPILGWPSCPCVTRVTWLGLEGTGCRQGLYGGPTGKGSGSQAPGARLSVLVSSGGRTRCVPTGPGLRVAPPPSFFAMLGARCILGKGPAPFSWSRPGGAAWVLRHRVTDHPPKSARQQMGSMGRSCWDRCLEAALGKSSRLGSQEDPQSLPHSGAAWTRQGAFSIWAKGRGPSWRSDLRWWPQPWCPPESSRVVSELLPALPSANVQGAQKDPHSRHRIQGGGWLLPSSGSANPWGREGEGMTRGGQMAGSTRLHCPQVGDSSTEGSASTPVTSCDT